jgi:hypothetical protein
MWQRVKKVVIYMDLGESRGMLAARKRVVKAGLPFDQRYLGNDWERFLTRGSDEPFTPAPSQFLPSLS